MIRMANAASQQAVEVGKERLREFLESAEPRGAPVRMSGRSEGEAIGMSTLDGRGKKVSVEEEDDDEI